MNEMSLVYKMSNIVSLLMELVVDCRRLDRNVSFKTTFNMPCLQALTFFGDFLLLFVANQNHGDTLFTLFSLKKTFRTVHATGFIGSAPGPACTQPVYT
jgi:hypothetical protein